MSLIKAQNVHVHKPEVMSYPPQYAANCFEIHQKYVTKYEDDDYSDPEKDAKYQILHYKTNNPVFKYIPKATEINS